MTILKEICFKCRGAAAPLEKDIAAVRVDSLVSRAVEVLRQFIDDPFWAQLPLQSVSNLLFQITVGPISASRRTSAAEFHEEAAADM